MTVDLNGNLVLYYKGKGTGHTTIKITGGMVRDIGGELCNERQGTVKIGQFGGKYPMINRIKGFKEILVDGVQFLSRRHLATKSVCLSVLEW